MYVRGEGGPAWSKPTAVRSGFKHHMGDVGQAHCQPRGVQCSELCQQVWLPFKFIWNNKFYSKHSREIIVSTIIRKSFAFLENPPNSRATPSLQHPWAQKADMGDSWAAPPHSGACCVRKPTVQRVLPTPVGKHSERKRDGKATFCPVMHLETSKQANKKSTTQEGSPKIVRHQTSPSYHLWTVDTTHTDIQ